MKRPYCRIGSQAYQLKEVDGILRFPNNRELGVLNANDLIRNYQNGLVPFEDVLDYYTNTGLSYYHIQDKFSPSGMNSHIILKGDHKRMILYDVTRKDKINSVLNS